MFGEYNDLEKALQRPECVRELTIRFPENLNVHGEKFLRFTKLRSLDIHTDLNHVPYVPYQIGTLKQLKRLSILNVPFLELPNWMFNLTNLEYLRVRGCEITDLPSGIKNLNRLKTLRIENCELKVLPLNLREMHSITNLSLTDTKVHNITQEDLPRNLKKLEIMNGAMRPELILKLQSFAPALKIVII